jgi:hypothetical protein
MAFWSDNFAGETELKDPKRKFRFRVEFGGIQGGATGGQTLWYAKTATKPSFQINSAEHKYLNHTFYYPGSVTWQEVTVTMVDPTDPDMAATLSAIVQAGGYSPPANSTDFTTMSKSSAAKALGTVIVTQMDAAGNDLEQWTLWNAFITEVKYGDLEYGADDLTELSVTLKYDWARIKTAGDSVATALSPGKEFFGV